MSVNKSWFSNFSGQLNRNEMLPNIGNNFSPSGMMQNGNFQVQRFPEPFIRGPPPFLARPPFPPRMNERNIFPPSQPHFSAPLNQPFVCGPRIPNRPPVRQPYSGNLLNHIVQRPQFPSQNGPIPRHFTHWNENPWNDSSKNQQWNNQMRLPVHSTFHCTPPNLQRPLQVDMNSRTNKTPSFNRQDHGKRKFQKPWMTNEISEAMEKRNEVRSFVKWGRPKSRGNVRKFKEEELIKLHPFLCDTCDKAFIEEYELNNHIKQHIKCNLDGCQFTAHPKVVLLHRKMQHDTGYAKAILKLSDPKEIEKWRNERRNRFPTAANIKKRQEENAEKMARGEIIETKDFGKFKRQKVQHNASTNHVEQRAAKNNRPHRNRPQKFRARYKKNKLDRRIQPAMDSNDDDDSHIQLPPFRGMQSTFAVEHDDLGIMDVCDDPNHLQDSQNILDAEEATASCPLSDYKQDIDTPKNTDDDILCSELVTIRCNGNAHNSPLPEPPSVHNEINNTVNDCDDDAPTVLPIMKSTENECPHVVEKKIANNIETGHPQEKKHGSNQVRQTPAAMRMNNIPSCNRNNLLEKLLAKEISHERNIVFQCIRYVVENNFFGVHSD